MLETLEVGNVYDVDVLITNIEKCVASNGSTYQKLQLRDEDGYEYLMNSFDFGVFSAGIVKAKIKVKLYNDAKTYVLIGTSQSDIDPSVFMPKPRIDIKAERSALIQEMKLLSDDMRQLVCTCISNVGFDRYIVAPLTFDESFSRMGGLLEATAKLLGLAKGAADTLELDKDLMATAAMLYNIGAARVVDGINRKKTAVLVGEQMHTFRIVTNAVEELGYDADSERLVLLMHILSSKYDMPSPSAVMESIVMRHLDYLVKKNDEVEKALRLSDSGNFIKDKGKLLYKRVEG